MHSYIHPNTHVALRLPSGVIKILEITPNTTINIGKFGTFSSNLLLGRPYYLTFELLDRDDGKSQTELRVVPASELHAEALGNEYGAPAESRDEPTEGGAEFDIVGEDGALIMRSNRMTVDDPSRQTLTMEEIEELKKAGTGSGKEIIAKIMASHMAIDEKTTFSLAKYTLRKSKKYLRRFTVLPVDVGMLTEYIADKEHYKILELREESLGLINSWANIHCGAASRVVYAEDGVSQIGGGRWLVVDDTGGLVVAALAERMGILYPEEMDDHSNAEEKEHLEQPKQNGEQQQAEPRSEPLSQQSELQKKPDTTTEDLSKPTSHTTGRHPRPRNKKPHHHIPQMSATTNSITLLHSNNQPNLTLLKYFSYDAGNPTPSHPLFRHLKSLSWLQLLSPSDDPSCVEPELIPDETLATMKSSKRGTYFKKRRRWERTSRVIEETRRGGFDGLIIASTMEPKTIMKELVPLVRGGGRVVVYSPNVEPLVELCDYYSKDRRAAYVSRKFATPITPETPQSGNNAEEKDESMNGVAVEEEDEDFPVNPTLLLGPSLQTARARHWQVLPQRTHPFMTSRGGAEGYLFTATRVIPAEGKVEARGHFKGKKRK
ncbi:Gcd10p-domain-containing protein, partial [Westerdykella ornata]